MGDTTHTPVCQYSGCSKSAGDYDHRHGRLIFYCNDMQTFHDPMSYAKSSYAKSLQIQCGSCGTRFRTDGQPAEDPTAEYDCPQCEEAAPLRV